MKHVNKVMYIYQHHYKKLLILPLLLVLLSFILLFVQYAQTGDFFIRDVSLKGGLTFTSSAPTTVSLEELEDLLQQQYADATVRSLGDGFVIDVGIADRETIPAFITVLESHIGTLSENDYNVRLIGSTLSESFLRQVFIAMLFSFVVMMLVVLLYFRTLLPSFFVIWTVFIDIVGTFAILNLLGEAVSVAGLAAFLMLIGYSVDTDILLTSRVLKSKSGTIFERVRSAMRTGLTMTMTALIAVLVAFTFTTSDTIRQIMLVLLIGITLDIIHTWLTNASVLRWWAERNHE